MALKKSFTDESGVVHSNAYHVVDNFRLFDKNKEKAIFWVYIYHTSDTRNNGDEPVSTKGPYTLSKTSSPTYASHFSLTELNKLNQNLWKRTYEYLKANVDYYSDASDV